ncbi:MAG: methylmalonyl Co-A mutase-associated GTPase MeaB [Bacteroidota bacterium]
MNEQKKDQPASKGRKAINPAVARHRLRNKSRGLSAADYVKGILEGDRILLSQAITLVESTRSEHQQLAQTIIEQCLPHRKPSVRIGITGSPGVGKSTFIEALGQLLINRGHQLAVLAIDPSSQVSKGSILGDKTRMTSLSTAQQAFIRPSPAGRSLGGVAQKTRATILLCEAAGFDTLLIETVGVGQSETIVHSMVDLFLLLLLPGAGDELQGIKRGIVEMADIVAINKADGDRLSLAKRTKREYRNALHLFPPKESQWTPQVVLCSALENKGITNIWDLVDQYVEKGRGSGYFQERRRRQAHYWLYEEINEGLKTLFFEQESIKNRLPEIEKAVLEGQLSATQAAQMLLEMFVSGRPKD